MEISIVSQLLSYFSFVTIYNTEIQTFCRNCENGLMFNIPLAVLSLYSSWLRQEDTARTPHPGSGTEDAADLLRDLNLIAKVRFKLKLDLGDL